MATYNQIYTILNSTFNEACGGDAITVKDTASFVQMGTIVLGSDSTKNKWLGVLTDRIGKTVIDVKNYSPQIKKHLLNSFEFGVILQKIYVEPLDAVENKAYNLSTGSSIDPYVISNPTVKQKLFSDKSTFEIDITIPDNMIKDAFESAEAMGAFITAIFTQVQNSLNIRLELALDLCYSNFIGNKITKASEVDGEGERTNKDIGYVKLVTNYNNLTGNSLPAGEKALTDKEFLRYATRQILLYKKRLERMSKLFNPEGYTRFTSAEDLDITVLSDFATACDTYLSSDTYHNSLVALPEYSEALYWQGAGDSYDFEDVSKIDIKINNTEFTKSNIIAIMNEKSALGITVKEEKATSQYNARGEYTNYFYKATNGYFNDLSENSVVFTLE